jgi:drug/metabolite transporter (DMT)-like permease
VDALLLIATTADWAPESINISVVLSIAGAGATLATFVALALRLPSEEIGIWSARGTAAGFVTGIGFFAAALILLPSRADSPEQMAAVLTFLRLSRRATWWLIPGIAITVVGVVLVDQGSDLWVAYVLAIVGTMVVVIGWGRPDLAARRQDRVDIY